MPRLPPVTRRRFSGFKLMPAPPFSVRHDSFQRPPPSPPRSTGMSGHRLFDKAAQGLARPDLHDGVHAHAPPWRRMVVLHDRRCSAPGATSSAGMECLRLMTSPMQLKSTGKLMLPEGPRLAKCSARRPPCRAPSGGCGRGRCTFRGMQPLGPCALASSAAFSTAAASPPMTSWPGQL